MLTMYTTDWCGFCARLKAGLHRDGIEYTEVDIERVEDAAEIVMQVNGGNRTVPTVVFADGTALTNPSVAQVRPSSPLEPATGRPRRRVRPRRVTSAALARRCARRSCAWRVDGAACLDPAGRGRV